MFWADQIGLATVVDALKRYEDRLGEGVTLSPLLLARAAEGKPLDR
jgi:3-hydroxyacyl-CoA dehydrogenase